MKAQKLLYSIVYMNKEKIMPLINTSKTKEEKKEKQNKTNMNEQPSNNRKYNEDGQIDTVDRRKRKRKRKLMSG